MNQQQLLPGLNTLRFIAAFFVVISHGNIALDKLGICTAQKWAFLNRGGDAVEFFFTLSGFLITFLLLKEQKNTGTISIKKFYLRRIFRIWPLYFLIVAIGFFLLGFVYPKIYHTRFFSFDIFQGILMFLFFMPNYMAKNYAVGLLNPLWSIGVEEQFYLFWAPLIKLLKKFILPVISIFILFSLAFYSLLFYKQLSIPENWAFFFLSQKFYAMAIGSFFGYILFFKIDAYNNSFFASKWFQLFIVSILVWHFFLRNISTIDLPQSVLFVILYGLLILNVSVLKNKLFNAENRYLSYLGTISYGIYMYHMLVDYFLRLIMPRLLKFNLPRELYIIGYYFLLVILTIFISAISYRYFEKYFLKMKEKLSPAVSIS